MSLILDFDGSVHSLPGADTVLLRERQEAIRFGCRASVLRDLGRDIEPALTANSGPVFLGSGDYHHVSYILIERMRRVRAPVQVVVFDNHPDNMRYPFGIHCGSWVRHASRLPFVSRVLVAGITSADVGGARLWENYLAPLYGGKVSYYCLGRGVGALRAVGIRSAHAFGDVTEMLRVLTQAVAAADEPVYLSIDKDVLSDATVRTNWDQGVMRLDELAQAVQSLRPYVVASDVVGDASSYRYRGWFKRTLSGLDRRPEIAERAAAEWRGRHREVNELLLSLLSSQRR